jgi:hypothetical protein
MKPLLALLGPLIWIVYFMVIYAAQGLACRGQAPAGDAATIFVIVATVLALGALLVALIRQGKTRGGDFLQRIAVPLTVLSLLGVAWAGMPALLLAACVPLGQAF